MGGDLPHDDVGWQIWKAGIQQDQIWGSECLLNLRPRPGGNNLNTEACCLQGLLVLAGFFQISRSD